MGVHFRPDLLGVELGARVDGNGTHVDFRQPSVLIYEPQDGSMQLVAVENLAFMASWKAASMRRRRFTACRSIR